MMIRAAAPLFVVAALALGGCSLFVEANVEGEGEGEEGEGEEGEGEEGEGEEGEGEGEGEGEEGEGEGEEGEGEEGEGEGGEGEGEDQGPCQCIGNGFQFNIEGRFVAQSVIDVPVRVNLPLPTGATHACRPSDHLRRPLLQDGPRAFWARVDTTANSEDIWCVEARTAEPFGLPDVCAADEFGTAVDADTTLDTADRKSQQASPTRRYCDVPANFESSGGATVVVVQERTREQLDFFSAPQVRFGNLVVAPRATEDSLVFDAVDDTPGVQWPHINDNEPTWHPVQPLPRRRSTERHRGVGERPRRTLNPKRPEAPRSDDAGVVG
jgi:hypothetical protein